MRPRLGLLVPTVAAVCLASALAACTATAAPAARDSAAAPSTPAATPQSGHAGSTQSRVEARAAAATTLHNWPSYHGSPSRSGHVTSGPTAPLHRSWSRALGPVYGEPLVVGSTLVVATEHNRVYGLNARTGAVRWSASLGTPQPLSGLPCGNIDPLGITGTPAYDATTGSVFLVAETTGGTHTLWALNPATGGRRWSRNLDTQTSRSKLAEQERGAVLVSGGRVIVPFGGLAGDCANYVGYVTSVATSGRGTIASYAVPTAREAGMWATPGAVRGANGHIYVASGNGAEVGGTWDRSDSVTELTAGALTPLSVFAPSTWADDNARDLDLGSSSPAAVPAVHRLVIAGKRGIVYLLPETFDGVGSELDSVGGCTAFGGAAVIERRVLMPCLGQHAIRMLRVSSGSISWGWTRSGVYGSPVIAGQRVYVADRDSGTLVVLAVGTGRVLSRQYAGPLPHFPSQVVAGDWVFVPTLNGVTAFRGS